MRGLIFCLALMVSGTAAAQSEDDEEAAPAAVDAGAAAKAFISATSGGTRHYEASLPQSQSSFGIGFATTPDGAQVVVVMPRSPAEEAGLTPGKTITSVNGISLRGLSSAEITAALHARTGRSVYGLAGGDQLTVLRP